MRPLNLLASKHLLKNFRLYYSQRIRVFNTGVTPTLFSIRKLQSPRLDQYAHHKTILSSP